MQPFIRRRGLAPMVPVLLAGTALLVASSPQPVPAVGLETWQLRTTLLEPVPRGSRTVLVENCLGFEVGSRVRLSFAGEEEEEGSVVSLSCPSPGLAHASVAGADAAEPPCDLAALGWRSPDGLDGEGADAFTMVGGDALAVSPRCQRLLAAAQLVPGLASTYQAARRTAKLSTGDGSAALLPMADPAATAAAPSTRSGTPGVLTLGADTLFAHTAHAPVRATPALGDSMDAASCPLSAEGLTCSARGACDAVEGLCVCEAGYSGAACEEGAAADASALRAAAVGGAADACAAGCGGHGECVAGVCACSTGWHGEGCAEHSEAACPSACGGASRGTCSVAGVTPLCLCKARFVGATCLEEVKMLASTLTRLSRPPATLTRLPHPPPSPCPHTNAKPRGGGEALMSTAASQQACLDLACLGLARPAWLGMA